MSKDCCNKGAALDAPEWANANRKARSVLFIAARIAPKAIVRAVKILKDREKPADTTGPLTMIKKLLQFFKKRPFIEAFNFKTGRYDKIFIESKSTGRLPSYPQLAGRVKRSNVRFYDDAFIYATADFSQIETRAAVYFEELLRREMRAINGDSRIFYCAECDRPHHIDDALLRIPRSANLVCKNCIRSRYIDKMTREIEALLFNTMGFPAAPWGISPVGDMLGDIRRAAPIVGAET